MTGYDDELRKFLEERDALYQNPTLEAATAYWEKHDLPTPMHPSVPLAMVHKARLQWLDATDAMLEESKQWLIANGYKTSHKGVEPLTPERRDADRKFLGKKPLDQSS